MELNCVILSMADSFMITDDSGQALYKVTSVPDVAERLSLRSATGDEIAAIVRDPMSGGFQVLIAHEQAALVRAQGFFRRSYLIDGSAGGLTVRGNVDQGTYALAVGASFDGQVRAQVWRRAVRYGARVGSGLRVVTADADDTVQLSATVLAVEYLVEDRRSNLAELKAARGLLRLIGLH